MAEAEERVVPWLNRQEFFDVYKGLYAQNASEQRRAVDKVAMWRCRAFKKLPVAIDSTSTLVESLLKKRLNEKSSYKICEHENKLSLAVSLIRFVNHIVDKGQTKQFAQSVHVLAEEFGLPEWLIDIRHDATHGCLPSLSLLEEGVLWSLDWLKSEYWEKQTALGEPTSSPGEDEDSELKNNIRKLLVDFTQIQFELVHNSDTRSDNSLKNILTEMESIFPKSKKTVITILGQEGYLILTRDQLDALGVDYNTLMELKLNLPNIILQFWKPVLKLLHVLRATPMLLESLARKLTTNESLENRLRVGWIFELVLANKRVKDNKKVSEKNLLSTYCELPVEQILQMCLCQPDGFSSLLVETLSKQGQFSDEFNKAVSLLQIFSGCTTSTTCDKIGSDSFHTQKDLQSVKSAKKLNRKHAEAAEKRLFPWQLCTDISWSNCPIGMIHGQDMKILRLELTSVSKTLTLDCDSVRPDLDYTSDCSLSDVQTHTESMLDDIDNGSALQSCSVSLMPVINIL